MKQYQVTMTEVEYNDWLEHLTNAVNIQEVKKPNKKEFGLDNKHPTIKPLKLMEWLVKLTTNEHDLVLDIFNGSGTTGQACLELNRNYIGIDMSKEYIDYTNDRLKLIPTEATFNLMFGDCLDKLKLIPDRQIDAILTDPPYAIAIADWDKFQTMNHFKDWCQEWGKEAFRV